MILAMLRNLPEGSRFSAATAADQEAGEQPPAVQDPRMEAVMDHRAWTLDRRLKAMQINALYTLIAVSGEWKNGKPPDFPTIGPAVWQAEDNPKQSEPKDNFDVLRKMGWTGG